MDTLVTMGRFGIGYGYKLELLVLRNIFMSTSNSSIVG
jgi:hypothetical protein